MNVDIVIFLTVIATGVAVIGFVYTFFRNFKDDFSKKFEDLDKKMVSYEERFEDKISSLEVRFENRMNTTDERMFLLSTGKSLSEAILAERNKRE